MSQVLDISSAEFETTVLKADKPVVVDFWAPWCGPCRMIAPSLDQLQQEWGDKVQIVKVNVDDNPDVAAKYGVRGIPTMVVFKNGEEAGRLTGALPLDSLRSQLGGFAGV